MRIFLDVRCICLRYIYIIYIYIYIVEVTQQSVEIKDKNGMQTTKQWHQQIRNCYLRTCGQGRLAALDMNQHPDFKESRQLGVLTHMC